MFCGVLWCVYVMDWTTKRKFECGKSNCCSTHHQESGESLHSCLSATANNKVYFYHPLDTSSIFTWVNSSTWLATSGGKYAFFSLFCNFLLFQLLTMFAYLVCVGDLHHTGALQLLRGRTDPSPGQWESCRVAAVGRGPGTGTEPGLSTRDWALLGCPV